MSTIGTIIRSDELIGIGGHMHVGSVWPYSGYRHFAHAKAEDGGARSFQSFLGIEIESPAAVGEHRVVMPSFDLREPGKL
ncbi:hypothetical protein KAF44_19525 (plasmid) [Cupriavidus necator]|nr:hypothetical protein KAF44_19525 [Cupriavidus necator]